MAAQTNAADGGQRTLTSVPLARARAVPWFVRRRYAAAEMRRRSPDRLDARLATIAYARPTRHAQVLPLTGDMPVWQFWATGADDAPPLVQRCLDSVVTHTQGRRYVLLDAENYSDYVTLPAHIEAKRARMGWTHFSDVLRVFLLAQHGGTWLDATVRLTAPVPSQISSQDFFCFTRPEDPFLLSSWFMHARQGDPITLSVARMLERYWSEHDDIIDYFLLHFLFEAAFTADPRLRSHWLRTPVHSYLPPHELQHLLSQRFDEQRLTALSAHSWIHKLTHKPPEAAAQPGTFYSWLSEN